MIDDLVAEVLDRPVVSVVDLPGGSICQAFQVRFADGGIAFAKTHPSPPPGFFTAEARGLRWLDEAGAVAVPAVVAATEQVLVLAWVDPGRPTTEAAERFGRALAALHASGATSFGSPADGYIGPLPLPNGPAASWPELYGELRLRPYLRRAADRGALDAAGVAAVERVIRRLDDLAGPPEPPARLHGDLWSGNLLWAPGGQVHLLDPAAHAGHRETDLAMLALFGAPHLGRILATYQEVAPLAPGWEHRVGLHQLHPLLVHAALFGAAYGARAVEVARLL